MIPGFVIILGSPNNENGDLSEMGCGRLRLGRERFLDVRGEGWKILLTGGFGAHFNTTNRAHAEWAKCVLLADGLVESDFVEHALSCNTVDDALKSREIVDKYKATELLIVTSDFHVPRVEFIFKNIYPDKTLTFAGASYIESRDPGEKERLLTHENRALSKLRCRGASFRAMSHQKYRYTSW